LGERDRVTDRDRIRVLHVITRLEHGGAPIALLNTLERMDRARYEVHIASGRTEDPEKEMIPSARARGLRVIEVPSLVRDVHLWQDLLAVLGLMRTIRRGRYDIVHTHTSKAGFVGRLASRLCGAKRIVYSPHGTILEGYFGASTTQLFVALDRVAAHFTDRIVGLTRREIEQYLEVGIGWPEQYTFIYNGIDVEKFAARRANRTAKRAELEIPRDAFVCLTVGRLVPIKGHRYLIDAVGRTRDRVSGLVVLFAGDGPLRSQLERHAAAVGVGDRVRFLGMREDVPELLSCSDLFVLPSLNEGLGLVLVEAMAMGVPCVATDVGGVPEVVVERTGVLVPPRDPRALADAVVSLVDDPGRAREMGARGKVRAGEVFSIQRTVERTEALYEELMAEEAGGRRQDKASSEF